MKKTITATIVLAVGLALSGCGEAATTTNQTPAAVTTSPAAQAKLDNYVGKNLKETRKLLETAGVKVTSKAANDKTILAESNWTITAQDPAAGQSSGTITLTATKPETAGTKAAPEPTESKSEENLTVENNEELAALLAGSATSGDTVEGFAAKYKGKTIDFDGNIAYMNPHGNSKTRYDILISAGNFSETKMLGPNFQFKDVNIVSDLHLTGSNIPDALGMGQNLRIIAQVEGFNSVQELFFLKPISTEVR